MNLQAGKQNWNNQQEALEFWIEYFYNNDGDYLVSYLNSCLQLNEYPVGIYGGWEK